MAHLKSISWLWESNPDATLLSTSDESAACDLTSYANPGIKGAISYSARYTGRMTDKAIFDDVLTLEIDESATDYTQFSSIIFEKIASGFAAYRATIVVDLDLDLDDYEKIVEYAQETRKDIDGRDSIYRFNPVNFFDEEMCYRAFGFGATEVANRLANQVERVSVQSGGVLIIATSKVANSEKLNLIHNHIAGLLGVETEVT